MALLFCACAWAQVPVTPKYFDAVQHTFATLPGRNTLDCRLSARQPELDFAFRLVTGFVFECPLRQFPDGKVQLSGYFRIAPRTGPPFWFTDWYRTPATPPKALANVDLSKAHVDLAASGAFAVGEGEYTLDALLIDQRGRFFHKNWSIRAARPHGQSAVPVALAPNTVAYIGSTAWDGTLAHSANGLRLTILLDAAALNPRQASLRAWDRAFLLQVLSAVLQKMPCRSVRLVAFNLDQQREIFRKDSFDKDGFDDLARALRGLELGTVSYKAIQRDHATELLARLANEQINAPDASDAVIFLGPSSYINQKTSLALLSSADSQRPRFYYLEYFPLPGGFPDAIHRLTKALGGVVFELHSPADLAKAIPRITADAALKSTAASADMPAVH